MWPNSYGPYDMALRESEINLWQSTGVNVISIWIRMAGGKFHCDKEVEANR